MVLLIVALVFEVEYISLAWRHGNYYASWSLLVIAIGMCCDLRPSLLSLSFFNGLFCQILLASNQTLYLIWYSWSTQNSCGPSRSEPYFWHLPNSAAIFLMPAWWQVFPCHEYHIFILQHSSFSTDRHKTSIFIIA
jgi:hypothetical protein